jgi:hypothetical protein
MRVLVVLLVVTTGCWREPAQKATPELSFVTRVRVLADLRTSSEALEPKLDVAMQRIAGLASEAERAAISDDLTALDGEVTRLTGEAREARERGDDPDLLAYVEHKIARAAISLAQCHEDLLHARTRAQLEAFEELKRKTEGTLDDDGFIRPGRRLNGVPPPGETSHDHWLPDPLLPTP